MSAPLVTTLTLNPAIDRTALIPGFVTGSVNRVKGMSDRPGGKGINVAAMLAGQGRAVAVLGFLGRDNDGVFKAFFERLGMEDRCLRLPGATRIGIKVVDSVRDETTEINFPGLSPSPEDLERLRAQMRDCVGGWCVLAGSLPPGVPPEIYRELIVDLRGRGVRTVLDTSGDALRLGLTAAPEVVKPNVHELEALVGRALPTEAEVRAAAQELIRSGVKLVVVSRGAQGAVFATEDRVVVARPPRITVGSTVGAGDAMVAGIVDATLSGFPLPELARRSTAFSVAALTRRGDAEPAPEVVEGSGGQVTVEETN